VADGAGEFLQGGAQRLGDQLQAGQVAHRRQDVGGVGALGGVVADQPGLLQPGQGQARSRSARPSTSSRSRKSPSTLWWKPGSSRSRPSAYLKSIRQSTASAALRSERSSRNCSTLTVASWAGEIPGRPSQGYQLAKASSAYRPPSRSRNHIAVVPAGLLARATRAVSSGTSTPRRGRIDIAHSSGISRDSYPRKTGPGRHRSQPNTKIPGRVKLRSIWNSTYSCVSLRISALPVDALPRTRTRQPAASQSSVSRVHRASIRTG
jgi:hypothetical protein